MRKLLPLLVCGCAPDGIAVPSGPVGFEVAADRVDGLVDESLVLTVDDLVLEATGPSGAESVQVLVDAELEPYVSTDVVQWSLEIGDHTAGELQVHLGAAGGPGLRFEAGAKSTSVLFDVEDVVLTFPIARLSVGELPTIGRLRLRPDEWLRDLGVEIEDEEEEEEYDDYPLIVVVEPRSGADYDRLLASIVRTTELEWGSP